MARRFDAGLLSGPPGKRVVFLLDAATNLEQRLLRRWLRSSFRGPVETVVIKSSRRGREGDLEGLSAALTAEDDPFLTPLRVMWMAPERNGRRSVGWSDIFKPGDPRDPWGMRAYLIRTFQPSRVKMVAAPGATAADLTRHHEVSDEIDSLESFVTRQAWHVLDVAERKLRGNRYKVPRFVPETILSRRVFVDSVNAYAAETGVDPAVAMRRAEEYLVEIAATHSPYVIDVIANAIHALYKQGYGQIRYDPAQVAMVAEAGSTHPVVFLPSHRSNLDRLSLQFMLWENDLPPNHTAGGVNLDFFPLGPLMRRTGVFFIRRSFKDNHLYKLVLRSYIDFLIEKRFPLEWYLEGGRSRSGKLLPPRYGLLQYVVDSVRRGKADDLRLLPVSIVYDQIQDVPDYAREAQGRIKEKESISWLFRAVRSLRRRYGDIHIRFGEPVSVASFLDTIEEGEEVGIGIQKLAFEVMHRIARATPVTPSAIVSIALLAARGQARASGGLAADCAAVAGFLQARGVEITDPADMGDPEVVTALLRSLQENGNVSSHEALEREVFWLDDSQMIQISYYRNVVVHCFVTRAIVEMSLASLLDSGTRDPNRLIESALEIRDLLKFEFFFPDRGGFAEEVMADLELSVPAWRATLASSGALGVIANLGAPVAYWAVLPFLDAYQVVGDELEATRGPFDERIFLKSCLARARMYRIEEKLISGESASQVLFKSALALAANRGLLDDTMGVEARRSEFAAQVRAARELAAFGL